MIFITKKQIEDLGITPLQCVEWVDEGFKMKYRSQMPAKTAIHLPDSLDFFMTMPCLLPPEIGVFGCKNASRFACAHPSVKSYMMLCDANNGDFLANIDCDWITPWRTGGVAALAIKTFQNSSAKIYSFMGLGCAGTAALECFLAINQDRDITVRLLHYKDHAERFVKSHSHYSNVTFEIVFNIEDLVRDADVITSAITQAPALLVNDTSLFKKGCLLVPIHTRGFQNCDLVFDKIFGDDTNQIAGFQYFNRFKSFNEFGKVLLNEVPGRENDEERIIAYNIGLGLHDVLFAHKIISMLESKTQYTKNQSITPPCIISDYNGCAA